VAKTGSPEAAGASRKRYVSATNGTKKRLKAKKVTDPVRSAGRPRPPRAGSVKIRTGVLARFWPATPASRAARPRRRIGGRAGSDGSDASLSCKPSRTSRAPSRATVATSLIRSAFLHAGKAARRASPRRWGL